MSTQTTRARLSPCFPRVAQENLFPSVSTVIKDTLANGQLVEYAKRQVAEAAWGNPPNSDSIILPANCELSIRNSGLTPSLKPRLRMPVKPPTSEPQSTPVLRTT